jgi:uncharacterized protein YbaP (TraB family)
MRRSRPNSNRFGLGSRPLVSTLCWALCCWALGAAARADTALHPLWELHGTHNTVYLLGSIHVLRPSDYPLPAVVQDAYRNAASLVMEINLAGIDAEQVQAQMLASALLPEGKSLPQVMGQSRYARAQSLTRDLGIELSTFDQFAPWFTAEAISQVQLAQIGFEPQSGVEMHFLEQARADGKSVAGLETVHDQIALFESMSMDAQVEYLMSSLEQAHDLPKQVDGMVHAWQRGDTNWFETQLKSELGNDPAVYQTLVVARNRKWIARIEALLADDKNYLVIVGTAHLVGRDSVIDLLKRDGIGAVQR